MKYLYVSTTLEIQATLENQAKNGDGHLKTQTA